PPNPCFAFVFPLSLTEGVSLSKEQISWSPFIRELEVRPAGGTLGGFMLKGTRTALVKKVQPVSIHGQISLDVYLVAPEDPDGQVSLARIGPEAVPRNLEAGD